MIIINKIYRFHMPSGNGFPWKHYYFDRYPIKNITYDEFASSSFVFTNKEQLDFLTKHLGSARYIYKKVYNLY